MAKILLLEDDTNLNETITEFLEEEGHEVISVFDGIDAQDKIYECRYDILLLDVNIPGLNGLKVLKEARDNEVSAPAIFITSLDSVDDLERGFESGCDDYIRKPFSLKELRIRIDTLLKRDFFHASKTLLKVTDTMEYDSKNSELIDNGKTIRLGQKESRLLKLFIQNDDEVIPHELIYSTLWDFDETSSDTALRTYIKNLRKLIGKEKIVSIKKQGYKFSSKE